MDDGRQSPADMWAAANSLSSPADADSFFSEFLLWMQEVPPKDVYHARGVLNTAVRTLIAATTGDVGAAEEIILRHIFPVCVEHPYPIPASVAEPREFREYLADWIEQYPDEKKTPLRTRVLGETLALLRSSTEATIRTISAIGFRSPEIEGALIRVARNDDAAGNAAMGCLAGLHPGDEIREALIRKVLRRFARRGLDTLGLAIQELASPQFIPVLRRFIKHLASEPATSESPRTWDQMRVVALLGRIAEQEPNNLSLQLRVWRVLRLAAYSDGTSRQSLLISGNGVASCNTAEVATSLLGMLGEPNAKYFLICNRLKDCILPRQLLGWHQANKSQLKNALTAVATFSTGGDGRSMTVEAHSRDLAWEIAFAAGIVDVDDWLDRLFKTETNPYGLRQIVSFASYIRLDHVPVRIELLVSKRIDIAQGSTEPLLGARIEAVQVLRAAASQEAFEILLNSGLTFQGSSLRRIGEAVADVAEGLSKHNGEFVVSHLIEASEATRNQHTRALAVVGLQRIAAAKILPERVLGHLLKLSQDDSLPVYAKAYVIWSLGCFSQQSTAHVVDCLLAYANDTRVDSELRFQSLDALIRLGGWRDYQSSFLQALGIPHSGATAPAELLRSYQAWQGSVLAYLFRLDPGVYYLPLSDLITHGRGDIVHIVLRILGAGATEGSKPLADLAKVATRRALDRIGRSFAETDNFESICRMSPDDFVDAGWETVWDGWMPAVRASVAEAINSSFSKLQPERQLRVFGMLEILLGDSTYQVRRSAGRTFSRCDGNRFLGLIVQWAHSGSTELRRRAAEMAQWLPPDDETALNNEIIRMLLRDPEPSVRATSARSLEGLRQGASRSAFINRILSEKSEDGNAWVSKAFCYGRALAKIGDDETLLAIRDLELTEGVPPNVQNWLTSVREDLESHWQDVTRGWPEPWLPWSGQLEEVDGAVSIGTDTFHVRLSLWYHRRDDPRKVASWGGAFQTNSTDSHKIFKLVFSGTSSRTIDIAIGGRAHASGILSTANLAGEGIFVGSGEYPGGSLT